MAIDHDDSEGLMTEKLYYQMPEETAFSATVTKVASDGAGARIVLDRTLFYPEGGGQAPDHGLIAGLAVIDVQERNGDVIHFLAADAAPLPAVGERVSCQIDQHRRRDHTCQHTGQHILSQAFLRLLNAETRSVHFGETASTIDLAIKSLGGEQLEPVEIEANRIVLENRPVTVSWHEPGGIERLGLRKAPGEVDRLRVVTVDGYDVSACGGTHVRSTGLIGPVKLVRTERIKKLNRVTFLCGERAWSDIRRRHAVTRQLGEIFNAPLEELAEAARKIIDRQRDDHKTIQTLKQSINQYKARELVTAARRLGPDSRLVRTTEDSDQHELRHLGQTITALADDLVALLGARSGDQAMLAFVRSQALELDLRPVFRAVASRFGLRGGGPPSIIQAGGIEPEKLDQALDALEIELREAVSGEGDEE